MSERIREIKERFEFNLKIAESIGAMGAEYEDIPYLLEQMAERDRTITAKDDLLDAYHNEVEVKQRTIARLTGDLEDANIMNKRMETALEAIIENSDDPESVECAQDVIDMKNSPLIQTGDRVVVTLTGLEGRISAIQYVHDRFQFKNISGWQYGISGLKKLARE
ncbi:hypothetical protein [Paenibacillus sp. NPDC055715]